jgi:hypothetical protein
MLLTLILAIVALQQRGRRILTEKNRSREARERTTVSYERMKSIDGYMGNPG